MRTALFLLLLLAVAAIPGSLVPQTSADPNGVAQYKIDHPELYPILKNLQVFDTYTSVWFSAIYLLLFISLIGCVIPRTKHHLDALRAKPPRTPVRLNRMGGFQTTTMTSALSLDDVIEKARRILKSSGYRVVTFEKDGEASVSAERGYLRETGNLVFHIALLGVLLAVGVGGGFGFTGQRVVTTGQTFVNTLVNYDSFNPGRFVNTEALTPYSVTLNSLDVTYEESNPNALGLPLDYTAHVTTKNADGATAQRTIKVNEPLGIGGTNIYLLGNGYAPKITVRNPAGDIVFQDAVPFLPQDTNLTSLGVVKVPDGLKKQLGMIGFFYPTAQKLSTGALASSYPALRKPVLTLQVFSGDLGINEGGAVSVYTLDTDKLTKLNGPGTKQAAIELSPGATEQLPGGLGTVTLDSVERFASFDVHHDPTQTWVLVFAILILGGLLTSLFVPRRRMWVKALSQPDGELRIEYAGLARGDDPGLDAAVDALATKHRELISTHATANQSVGLPS
ncbi:MAG TPA: cytochrome c biogenesis protein ResB [Microbacteriaceae bacterium]